MSVPASFLQACEEQGIELTDEHLDRLRRYVARLIEVNQWMNLTAVREEEGVWSRHIFDSLLVLSRLKADAGQKALDLGSGGGFPGLVLAILRPDMEWLLVDSVGKKARFLQETADDLGLKNVLSSSERAEVLGQHPGHRETYSVVTARAVARLNILMELTVPLLRKGGHLLAMKGEKAPEEMREARRAVEILRVNLLFEEVQPGGGTLLDYKKMAATPKTYPRGVGVPGQKPL